MPRESRLDAPGALPHVIGWGIGGTKVVDLETMSPLFTSAEGEKTLVSAKLQPGNETIF